jgi:hypothetical protein
MGVEGTLPHVVRGLAAPSPPDPGRHSSCRGIEPPIVNCQPPTVNRPPTGTPTSLYRAIPYESTIDWKHSVYFEVRKYVGGCSWPDASGCSTDGTWG